MKKISFTPLWIFLFFFGNIFAQTPAKITPKVAKTPATTLSKTVSKTINVDRNSAVRILNGYIDYCNETIHALWGIEREIDDFYNTLTSCTNDQRACKFYSFYNKDYLNEKFNYEVIPPEIYENNLKNSVIFEKTTFQGENIQQKLNEKLTKIKEILDVLQTKRDFLFEYAKKRDYDPKDPHTQAWATLKEIETIFEQYHQAKNDLVTLVRAFYEAQYQPSDKQPQITKASTEFLRALNICKNILVDTDKADTTKIRGYNAQIAVLITEYEAEKENYLKNIYSFGKNNGLDPTYRYEAFVRDLKAFLEKSENSLKVDLKKLERKSFKELLHKHYNGDLINKYNRYGLGVVQAFNTFIALANGKEIQERAEIPLESIKSGSIKLDINTNVLLKWAEEPHKFKMFQQKPKEIIKEKEKEIFKENIKDIVVEDNSKTPETNFKEVEVGKAVALKNVLFKISTAELLPDSKPELDNLAKFMQENASAEIQLEGHTDIEGNAQGNMNLSKSRVEVIRTYLMNHKISKKRIRIKWFGASKPLRTDGSYEDRKINRRVECILVKK